MSLIIKGFIVGIGKIIPGVSGALLAITLGIYEPIIEKVSNFKREYMGYLFKIGIGVILSIVMTSKVIVKCLNNYYFPTMLLFVGMIIGGTKEIINNINIKKVNFIFLIFLVLIVLILTFFIGTCEPRQINYSFSFFLSMIGIGFLDAASSIIPGISGTALLICLGYYNIVMNLFSTALNFSKFKQNLFIGIPFIIGIILGILIISKLLNYLFKNMKCFTYLIIFLFLCMTTFILIKNIFLTPYTVFDIVIGVPLFCLGFILVFRLGNK